METWDHSIGFKECHTQWDAGPGAQGPESDVLEWEPQQKHQLRRHRLYTQQCAWGPNQMRVRFKSSRHLWSSGYARSWFISFHMSHFLKFHNNKQICNMYSAYKGLALKQGRVNTPGEHPPPVPAREQDVVIRKRGLWSLATTSCTSLPSTWLSGFQTWVRTRTQGRAHKNLMFYWTGNFRDFKDNDM